jgi:hypothetical protein
MYGCAKLAGFTDEKIGGLRLRLTPPYKPPLPQRNCQPAQVDVRHQPHLTAGQFQHRALLVGEHDRAGAAADRKARAGSAVDAGDIRRTVDVADPAAQHRLRPAEHQAVIQSAGGEPVISAVEVQRAASARAADDPSGFVNRERDRAALGVSGGGQRGAGESRQREQCNTNCG